MASQLLGMESFREFQSFSNDNSILAVDGGSQTHVESFLPRVNITADVLHPPVQPRNEAALAFISKETQITVWKKFYFIMKTQGVTQAFELLSHTDFKKSSINRLTRGLFTVLLTVEKIRSTISPSSGVTSGANTISMFSHTKDWSTSPIRCMAWHPHCNKLAVATRDDTVLVYAGPTSVPVVVRHSSQKDLSCLAWRPLCSAQLAVGCANGVAIWTVDPASLGTRPSASCLTHLAHTASVNTLCWHPQGKYLASGSAKESSLYIWCVENREATLLHKFHGGGYTYLSWSPSGERLLAATPSSVFRIWETRYWSADNWDVMEGHVQAAAWSPCGSKALFADSVQPSLYCLSVDPVSPLGEKVPPAAKGSSSKAASVVADFTENQQLNDEIKFGGLVQDLVWDPRGERLAVMFRSSDSIALFRTRYSPTVTVFPCGILKGQEGEVASTMVFKPEFDGGALLTVAWSSGRVQHVPFSFLAQNVEA